MNIKLNPVLGLILAACSLALVGCGDTDSPSSTAVPLPDSLFVATAPEGVKPIPELKQSAKEGDEVVVRVVVGGNGSPITEGRAAANIIDAGINNGCLIEEDHCEKPWDYCCTPKEEKLVGMASLQVVDEDGKVIAGDFSTRIKPMDTLVVRGVVGPRPDPNVLTIHATAIYTEPTQ